MVDPVHGGIHLERFLPLGPLVQLADALLPESPHPEQTRAQPRQGALQECLPPAQPEAPSLDSRKPVPPGNPLG